MKIRKEQGFQIMIREFKEYGREGHFSESGLKAIYDYMEGLDPSWELDVVAVCCDFCEFNSLDEVRRDFGLNAKGYPDLNSIEHYLSMHTSVIRCESDCIVIANF